MPTYGIKHGAWPRSWQELDYDEHLGPIVQEALRNEYSITIREETRYTTAFPPVYAGETYSPQMFALKWPSNAWNLPQK